MREQESHENPVQQAWEKYRTGKYAEALNDAERWGETVESLELQAYIYAYSKVHRDRSKVDPNSPDSIVSKLKLLDPENISADNAIIIYEIERRLPDKGGEPIVDENWIRNTVERQSKGNHPAFKRANLLQNAARYFTFFTERNSQNRGQALSWIDEAIGLYDQSPFTKYADILAQEHEKKRAEMAVGVADLHHIAGAFFRRFEAYNLFGDVNPDENWREKALEALEISEKLWKAVADSSGKLNHQTSWERTAKQLREFKGQQNS